MTARTKLTIDRATWLRGGEDSMLLNNVQHRCCLGFYLGACGVPDDALYDEPTPEDIAELVPPDAAWLVQYQTVDDILPARWVDSRDGERLMSLNDETDLDEAQREQQIAEVFAQHGVEVSFVGERGERER